MSTFAEEIRLVNNELTKFNKVKITKDVRRSRFEPDLMGLGEWEETYYTVTCYIDGEKYDSKTVKSVLEAGEIAQSYESFIKCYKQN
jgi:hypothetical protein